MRITFQDISRLKKIPLSVVQLHVLNCLVFTKVLNITIAICLLSWQLLTGSTFYLNTLIFILVFANAVTILHLNSGQMKKVQTALKVKAKELRLKDH